MQTALYRDVRNTAARLLGLDPDRAGVGDLNSARASSLAEFINLRVEEGWKFGWHPDWLTIDRRRYRAVWTATTYSASTASSPTEVYYLPAQKYYQCIKNATATDLPATLSGSTYTVNAAYWAECATSYDADDWLTGTVYAAGDQVIYPADRQPYQCHTAHTAGATFDATKFGLLTSFAKTLPRTLTGFTEIDAIKCVSTVDPRVYPESFDEWGFAQAGDLWLIDEEAPAEVYVAYRAPAPLFIGTAYSATTAYVTGDLCYYATTGSCYKALASTTGNLPTDTSKWAVVQFPAALKNFVARAAAADVLRDAKQPFRARDLEDRAYEALYNAYDFAQGQQSASQGATVVTGW